MVYNNLYERKYHIKANEDKRKPHISSTPLNQGHLLFLTRKRRPDNKYIDNQQVLNRRSSKRKKKKKKPIQFFLNPHKDIYLEETGFKALANPFIAPYPFELNPKHPSNPCL